MTRREEEGLRRLHDDAMEPELPSPELLARYATDPNGLDPALRREVEEALARSPAVVDELDTLRHFDFSSLATEPARESWAARVRSAFLARPPLWLAAAAAAALLLVLVSRPDGPGETASREVNIAHEASTPAPPQQPEPAMPPAEPAPQLDDATRLADAGSATETPAPAPTPRQPVPAPPTEQLADTAPAEAPAEATGEPEASASEEILLAMAMPVYEPAYGLAWPGGTETITRSAPVDAPRIRTAAPRHVTRASSAQPVLHWTIDRLPPAGTFHLSIVDRNDEPIVMDLAVPTPASPGLQRLDLAAAGVTLPTDRELRWAISLREDEYAPPTDFDFGWLRVAPLEGALSARIAQSEAADRIALYAGAGCFHDALEAALVTLAAHPDAPAPRRAFDELVRQADLGPVAPPSGS